MSITLNVEDNVLASLPFGPGELERHMQIELACRYYGNGWLSFAQGAQMAQLDHYAFALQLSERNIPRQYGLTETLEEITNSSK